MCLEKNVSLYNKVLKINKASKKIPIPNDILTHFVRIPHPGNSVHFPLSMAFPFRLSPGGMPVARAGLLYLASQIFPSQA